MKLSEVVAYINYIDQDDLNPHFDSIVTQAAAVLHGIVNHSFAVDSFADDLATDFDKIGQSIDQFRDTISALRSRLKEMAAELEPQYYANSTSLYRDEMIFETNEYILNRRLSWSSAARQRLLDRVKLFTDWRVPGMILRPGLEDFIENLVPLDPLYIVDQHTELLQPSLEKFNEQYQRRLRTYIIDDRQPGKILGLLPDGQYGFVFAFNYFNFKPIELIFKYLDEVYEKLRPGGRVIFTYNDCDYANGVKLAEQYMMCYTPGHRVKAHAESLGFEIHNEFVDPPTAAWLELKKPGEIESIRGGQTLAKVKPK